LNTFITFRVIFTAALIALATGPLAFWLADKLGLVDVPGSAPHKLHKQSIPLAGGIVLFVTILVVALLEKVISLPTAGPILWSSLLIFLFGLWDDVKELPPLLKLAGQLLATGLLIYFGVHVRLFHQEWLNYSLTVLWVVGVTNAYNFVDSMDGLAIGLGGLAAAFFMLVTIDSQQAGLSLFSTIIIGACLGSFYYNAAPAHFFLGDSGSQFLGFILAGLGIAYNPLGFSRLASWYVPILLVGVPIFDASLVIFSRLRHGKPIYVANRDHTFHRLVSMGMSSNRAVLTMHVVALLLGCLAFIALDLPPLIANLVFASVLLLGILTLLFLDIGLGLPEKYRRRQAAGWQMEPEEPPQSSE